MSDPTTIGREWAIERALAIAEAVQAAESECKALLDQRVYQNGIRGAAQSIRGQLEETHSTIQKLRKAIHDDFGSPGDET